MNEAESAITLDKFKADDFIAGRYGAKTKEKPYIILADAISEALADMFFYQRKVMNMPTRFVENGKPTAEYYIIFKNVFVQECDGTKNIIARHAADFYNKIRNGIATDLVGALRQTEGERVINDARRALNEISASIVALGALGAGLGYAGYKAYKYLQKKRKENLPSYVDEINVDGIPEESLGKVAVAFGRVTVDSLRPRSGGKGAYYIGRDELVAIRDDLTGIIASKSIEISKDAIRIAAQCMNRHVYALSRQLSSSLSPEIPIRVKDEKVKTGGIGLSANITPNKSLPNVREKMLKYLSQFSKDYKSTSTEFTMKIGKDKLIFFVVDNFPEDIEEQKRALRYWVSEGDAKRVNESETMKRIVAEKQAEWLSLFFANVTKGKNPLVSKDNEEAREIFSKLYDVFSGGEPSPF